MNGQVISHLVRRGLEATAAVPQDPSILPADPEQRPPWEILRDQLPGWAGIPVGITILFFVVLVISVRYTLMGVVSTLAQVETPTGEYMPLGRAKDDDQTHDSDPAPAYSDIDGLNPGSSAHADPELVLVAQRPITSSIRGTLRHISAIGGFRARWRGLSIAVCTALVHMVVYQILLNIMALILPVFIASVLGGVMTTVILARWYMAWTHIVISDPSPVVWYKRVPTFKTWKNIWAPTAINALAAQAPVLVLIGLFSALGFNDQEKLQRTSAFSAIWKMFLIAFVMLITWMVVVLPSEVALTRCQASLLPEEDESVVPFDRSFGGKVTPAIIGGTGMLSFIDAWKSFDRPAMVRLVKLYAKIFAIDVALHLLFVIVVTIELLVLSKGHPKDALAGDS